MKKTEAYIKAHKLTDVTMALRRVADLSGATAPQRREHRFPHITELATCQTMKSSGLTLNRLDSFFR